MTRAQRSVILYDRDCGLCKWSLAKLLAWDRERRLRPVALQDPEADVLLGHMDEPKRIASWHLVSPEGHVYSAGGATAPLMRLLPGGRPVARLADAAPEATERLYRWVSHNRGLIGRLIPDAAVERAARRIERRSA